MSSTSSSRVNDCGLAAELRARLRARVGLVARDVDVARLVVPRRDLVAPPQLARDAPVLDVVDPVQVRREPLARHEAHRLAGAGRARRADPASLTAARHRSWIDLPGKNGCVAGAGVVMSTNHWSVSIGSTTSPVRPQRGTTIVCAFSETSRPAAVEIGEHRLARDVAIEAAILRRRVVVDRRVEVEDRERRQAVALRRSASR